MNELFRSAIEKDMLGIQTLGNFHVCYNRNDLTVSLDKSVKVWELFKFLLTFRDELVLPEKIIQSLWPDSDYTDPKRTLRALIFRLRKALVLEGGEDKGIIIFSHGCYKLDSKGKCMIDVVEFERIFREAYDVSKDDCDRAIELFNKVIAMYKGDYLSETCCYDWLIPPRNYYRRIFLQSVYEVSELLKEQKRYHEILSVCDAALRHELFEEELHLFYIEALARTGKLKQARNHYEYIKQVFERELGVKPSDALNRLYRMLFGEVSKSRLDLNSIEENLRQESVKRGPVLCDKEFFKALWQLDMRRAERYGKTNFLGLVTLSLPDYSLPDPKILHEGMKELRQLLLNNLRKGDVVTEWNEAQFLLSLPSLSDKQAEIALRRVQNRYKETNKIPGLMLHYKIEDSLPPG